MSDSNAGVRSLYIAYFGVGEPLVQTQVIPYLRELVKGGNEMTLLTFESGDVDEAVIRKELMEQGIEWHWLRYHKRPSVPATLFDILNGARFIRKIGTRKEVDILHARSHVPMMMAAIARKISINKPKLLFDIRGFMPEEYVDAGVWPGGGTIFRGFKRVENWLMNEADGFIVLTEAARNILFPGSSGSGRDKFGRPVEVIPCCVDLDSRFSGERAKVREEVRTKLGVADRTVFTHVGALGGLYLAEEIADLLGLARKRNESVFAMFLTQSDPELIVPLLKERGFTGSDMFVAKVAPAEIENYLYASDVGISFVKASYATQSRSPTKIPEYLACGLPVIANRGVGDVDNQLIEDRTGVIADDLSERGYAQAIDEVEKLIAEGDALADRCKLSAKTRFDLESVGGRKYCELYRAITGNRPR